MPYNHASRYCNPVKSLEVKRISNNQTFEIYDSSKDVSEFTSLVVYQPKNKIFEQ